MKRHTYTTPIIVPSSRGYNQGKFGRIFAWLPPAFENDIFNKRLMKKLSKKMLSTCENKGIIPAGYTYLAQFIAHDISFDPTSVNKRQLDPEYIENFRTPALDLDSIYGRGPQVDDYLYNPNKHFGQTHFHIKKPKRGIEADYPSFDIPRIYVEESDNQQNSRGGKNRSIGVLADPRNDENILVSQLHVAFLRFHNQIIEKLLERIETTEKTNRYFPVNSPRNLFLQTQRIVRWHFQYLILFDFLPRLIDLSEFEVPRHLKTWENLTEEIKMDRIKKQIEFFVSDKRKRKYFTWQNQPFIPLEFSVAAFRFGHSQVRKHYKFNQNSGLTSIFKKKGKRLIKRIKRVDWSFFFPAKEKASHSNRLDTSIISLFKTLPSNSRIGHSKSSNIHEGYGREKRENLTDLELKRFSSFIMAKNLAARNLIRGLVLGIPSGQNIAQAMGLTPLTRENFDELDLSGELEVFKTTTPLWYYILHEAKIKQNGERLGPVGSRIVAEVIIGIIQGDKSSFVNQHPKWKPELPHVENGEMVPSWMATLNEIEYKRDDKDFTMADFLKYAGVYGMENSQQA